MESNLFIVKMFTKPYFTALNKQNKRKKSMQEIVDSKFPFDNVVVLEVETPSVAKINKKKYPNVHRRIFHRTSIMCCHRKRKLLLAFDWFANRFDRQ